MKIAYHTNEVNYRGLFRATIDYIKYSRKFWGHDGIIIAPDEKSKDSQHDPLGKVLCSRNAIKLFQYPSGTDRGKEPLGFDQHVDRIVRQENCNALYVIKGGDVRDDRVSKIVPTLNHGWRGVPREPTVGAGMSRLASIKGLANYVYVPTIVEKNESRVNWRDKLGIPENAIVFGNMGGDQVFNMIQPKRIIGQVIQKRKDIFFIFLGIKPIRWDHESVWKGCIGHPQVKFLSATVDDSHRWAFINTCDAMIHGRKQGEMGGGAIAEFSMSNKPIFTSNTGKAGARLYLGKKAFVYSKDEELYNWIMNFDRVAMAKQDWDCYSHERLPEPAMKKFEEVFLKVIK